MKISKSLLSVAMLALSMNASAQTELYPQHFNLSEVTLLDGQFKTAMDKNIEHLLQYDVDRLLTPYVRQAGLNSGSYAGWESKHPNFENWGSGNFRLDGHVGGHYLTALALAYAVSRDEAQRSQLKQRIDHMVEVMNDCQKKFDSDKTGLYGMISGVPNNAIWTDMYKGTMPNFGVTAVPLYTQHKVFAGLRDAYIYAGNEQAKQCFLKMADWFVGLFHAFTADQQQRILDTEHGGVNETMADAYLLAKSDAVYASKAAQYLDYAKKYSHQSRINNMQTLNTSYLDNQHANTQVPKYIGFERIYQLDNSTSTYHKAAQNFWTDVATNRTVCIGGNSVNEHFLAASGARNYMNELDGPESCNSNNMLKLSEELFDQTHDAKYADFYESTTINHILSTQDPVTGGYVYFTPLRPQSYRIYSKPNQDMWCCVGTGMENHQKYGHFIYTKAEAANTLYVNLFVASTLQNDAFALTQETQFPYANTSTITIEKDGTYAIAVRHPAWAEEGYKVTVNGTDETGTVTKGRASFVTLASRQWKAGDKIEITLPMALRYEVCPNLPEYIAFKYGPVLLGAKTSQSEDASAPHYDVLTHEYALGERMGHSPNTYTQKKSITTSPLILCNRNEVLSRVTPIDLSKLTFSLDASRSDETSASYTWQEPLTLAPYYTLHHARVSNYFYQATLQDYNNSTMAISEQAALALDARTITAVATGEQQSEAGITSYSTDVKGSWKDEYYRSAENNSDKAYVQYVLANPDQEYSKLSIMCRFTLDDKGRKGTLWLDDVKLTDFTIGADMGNVDGSFVNYELLIPEDLIRDANGEVKKQFTLKIQGNATSYFPSIYYLRLMRETNQKVGGTPFAAAQWGLTGDAGRVSQDNVIANIGSNTITVKASGNNNVCLMHDKSGMQVTTAQKYLIIIGTNLSVTSGKNYLWWLNGKNKGSQVAPTRTKTLDGGEKLIVWDITKSDINDNCTANPWIHNGNTIFGLTSLTGTSVISYIGFVSDIDEAIATAIESVEGNITDTTSNSPRTRLYNKVYNLNGQAVNPADAHHGIYIQHGKKVVR